MSNLRVVYGNLYDGTDTQALPGRKVFYKTKRQAANAYRAAARFLEKNPERWTRGNLFKGWVTTYADAVPAADCKVCAVGALNLANVDDPRGPKLEEQHVGYTSTKFRFQGYLMELEGTERAVLGKSIVTFNDQCATGPRDVVRALRKVASALDHGAEMNGASNYRIQEV